MRLSCRRPGPAAISSNPCLRRSCPALVLAIAASVLVLVLSSPASAEEPLWPNEVRRIDPGLQNFERLPARPPTVLPNARPKGSFKIRGFFRVRDSVSFVYKKKNYRLAGTEPVANSKICLNDGGRKWACGIMARNKLEELLTSRDVFCVPTEETDTWIFVECGKEDLDIASDMIERGFAETR